MPDIYPSAGASTDLADRLNQMVRPWRESIGKSTLPQDLLGGLMSLGYRGAGAISGNNVEVENTPEGDVVIKTPMAPIEPITLGKYQLFNPANMDSDLRKHEARHSAQSRALGLDMLPLMLREGLGGAYGSGPLERDAMRHVQPRGPEVAPARPYAADVESMLREILGE